jgi:hypothetical protein
MNEVGSDTAPSTQSPDGAVAGDTAPTEPGSGAHAVDASTTVQEPALVSSASGRIVGDHPIERGVRQRQLRHVLEMKLSARKKKPSRGRLTPLAIRRYALSAECERRVPNRKFLLPPSALKPSETAMASRRVDFPDPFSPTKKVTFACRLICWSALTTGKQKGYRSKDSTLSRRLVMSADITVPAFGSADAFQSCSP